ncbi:hypothetical protein BDZ88DRAFT_455099 [Geranomyces variabilis]|nr:hypothetical protein BDZ88DRAFT_455099 [Geranomyces variabilis]KAJ3133981.1 hypothetical protein HDU90_005329 [Geranomyces variabilis]
MPVVRLFIELKTLPTAPGDYEYWASTMKELHGLHCEAVAGVLHRQPSHYPTAADPPPLPAVSGPTHPSLQTSRDRRLDCALTRKERALLGPAGLNTKQALTRTSAILMSLQPGRQSFTPSQSTPPPPYDSKLWSQRLRAYSNPNRRVRQRYSDVNNVAPYVRRLLELEFGQKLARADQKLFETLIEQMRENETSDELFDFAVAESIRDLEDCRSSNVPLSQVVPAAVRMTCQAEDYVNNGKLSALKQLAAVLEDVPDHKKDWRVDTGQQVLDLVHPSLYCYAPGVTCCRDMKESRPPAGCPLWVPKYMWLPTDFEVDQSGTFVPLFESVASDFVAPRFKKLRLPPPNLMHNHRFEYGRDPEEGMIGDDPVPEFMFDPAFIHPQLPPLEEPLPPRDMLISQLQVIVKLVNVHLTPDNPKYGGGSWHTEASAFEAIFATGIYYYDMDNITTPRLEFRHDIWESGYDSPQFAVEGVKEAYGVVHGGDSTQHLGAIDAIEGRCIAFPNNFQHRVEPFTLTDASKPGHLKTLTFVDPAGRRLSTARVPPQRVDWFVDQLRTSDPRGLTNWLPNEVWKRIAEDAGLTTHEQACEHRAELRKERVEGLLEADEGYFTNAQQLY